MGIKTSEQAVRTQSQLLARLNAIQEKVNKGQITPEEARTWLHETVEDSNVLYLAQLISNRRS